MPAGGGSGVVFDDGTLAVQARQWSIGGGLSIGYDAEGRPQLISSTGGGSHALGDHTDVTISSPSAGHFLRYNGSDWVNAAIVAGDVPVHDIISKHTASGLTAGHFMKATGATTFAFQAHGLTYSDVGAAAATHYHAASHITSGLLPLARGGTGDALAGMSTDAQDLIVGAPDGGSLTSVPHPKALKTLQAQIDGTYLWTDAGSIGGTVTASYLPYASAANTLSNSPLYRTSDTLVEGDCDLYLHSEIDHYFRMYTYGDNTAFIAGYGSGGTKASPTPTNTQWVLQFLGVGYDGASWQTGAYIGFYASSLWDDAPAEHSMYIEFATRNTSGALTPRWRISEGGAFYPLSSLQIGTSNAYVSAIYVNYVYGQHHMEVATASDSAEVSINYSGYQGGTTYYRDFRVYDGKHQAILSVDGSYHAVTVPGGLLLIDGIDSSVPTGNIGFAENGGNFWMSGRHNHYFHADNDGNAQTSVHGFYWQTGYNPPTTKMSLAYNTTVGDFVLALPEYFIGYATLKLVGSQPAGNSNISYLAFYANDGSTRTGYVGEASTGDRDIYIYADVGNIRLSAPSGDVLFSSIKSTGSITMEPSVGALAIYNYGYQAGSRYDFYRAEGTPGSKSVTIASTIGEFRGYGWDGSAWVQGAGILFQATGTWSGTNHPADIRFYTRTGSGPLTERLRIQADGSIVPQNAASIIVGNHDGAVQAQSATGFSLYNNELNVKGDATLYIGYRTTAAIQIGGNTFPALRPAQSGQDLGTSSLRWDAYLQNALVYGQTYPGNGIFYPSSTPDHRDVTGSLTINWNNNQVQTVSMGAGTLTIYIDSSSNMQIGGTYHLVVFGPASGSQTLNISGVDIWIGTAISSLSLAAGKVVSVNFIKLRNRADDSDLVIGNTVLDQETVPF